MRIGIDLDGVVYDFHTTMLRYMKARGIDVSSGQPDRWNMWECYGISLDDFLVIMKEESARGLFRHGDAIQGAPTVIRWAKHRGHSIHIVTHRNGLDPLAMRDTALWLAEQNIPYDSLTFSPDKHDVRTDLFVDDSPANCAHITASGGRAIIFNRPWNLDAVGERVNSWLKLGQLVRQTELVGIEPPPTVLAEAASLVHGDRNEAYGHPIDDFRGTGAIWGGLVRRWRESSDIGDPIPPELVALMMAGLKLNRETNKRKRDNLVDAAGYVETASMVIEAEDAGR